MATVKRIGPGSAFKIGLVTYAILGLVLGIFMASISGIMGSLGRTLGQSAVPGASFFGFGMGLGAIVFFPICYGLFGGVFAAIGALIYNLVAGWVGGLEVDIS
ncbi:MAG TPA: DUF3566 domain-containing protein [Candidatus Acidoferrum sp.]|nr:DUF3566 domain-containing protein [Candidatus Acidoferrum sp.]